MRPYILLFIILLMPTAVMAEAYPPRISASGVAVYGWKGDEPIPLYVKNEHFLHPIASITKLVTAKVAVDLYKPETVFTISPQADATLGIYTGFGAGAQFTRDDLLRALLISSNNDAASAFMDPVGTEEFITRVNAFLHEYGYTTTSFVNPSGLDPIGGMDTPNRMTPHHVSRLLNDIYTKDPLLSNMLGTESAELVNLATSQRFVTRQSFGLYRDPAYRNFISMSKTGRTTLAKDAVAFITQGNGAYDHISVVILGSESRIVDSKAILDWLSSQKQFAAFTSF